VPARVCLACPLVVANMLHFTSCTSWYCFGALLDFFVVCMCVCVRVEDSNGTNGETWSGQNAKKPVITLEGKCAEVKFGKELAKVHFEHRSALPTHANSSRLVLLSLPTARRRHAACVPDTWLVPKMTLYLHSHSIPRHSVDSPPSIQVSPHNVVVSFKKQQEKLWDVLPGTLCARVHVIVCDCMWCVLCACIYIHTHIPAYT